VNELVHGLVNGLENELVHGLENGLENVRLAGRWCKAGPQELT